MRRDVRQSERMIIRALLVSTPAFAVVWEWGQEVVKREEDAMADRDHLTCDHVLHNTIGACFLRVRTW